MQKQYFLKLQSISQLFIFSAGAELLRVVQLESMPGYKYPNIDSGATPIGRADSRTRRFQEVEELKSKIEEIEDFRKTKIEEVKDLKFGDSTRVCNSN
jgi:hypothetical protein